MVLTSARTGDGVLTISFFDEESRDVWLRQLGLALIYARTVCEAQLDSLRESEAAATAVKNVRKANVQIGSERGKKHEPEREIADFFRETQESILEKQAALRRDVAPRIHRIGMPK